MAETDDTSSPKVASLSCGSAHSLALILTSEGDITASWGRGEDGQLGHGDAEERLRPQSIFGLMNKGITSVHCGAEYSIAVAEELREVYSWGWGDFGRLGHGDCKDVFIPTAIQALSGLRIVSASCGDTHTLVVTDIGKLFSFGRNQNGQLGYGNTGDSLAPQQVTALDGKRVVRVACGAEHSICSTDDGEVYAWGWGRYGNIGDGATEDRHVPIKVAGLDGVKVTHVACGWRHTLSVDDNGLLYSWGWSKYGQLGHGDHCDQLVPKKVEALSGNRVALVAGGWRHTLAADDQGRLFGWGWNKFGQLGIGHTHDVCMPEEVVAISGKNVQLLSSGWKHTLVVTKDGEFYSWGRGVTGQLGSGGIADANVPVKVEALSEGGFQLDSLRKQSHHVVMYSPIPAGDRYAVVPDHGGDGDVVSVPDIVGIEGPAKKQRL